MRWWLEMGEWAGGKQAVGRGLNGRLMAADAAGDGGDKVARRQWR